MDSCSLVQALRCLDRDCRGEDKKVEVGGREEKQPGDGWKGGWEEKEGLESGPEERVSNGVKMPPKGLTTSWGLS